MKKINTEQPVTRMEMYLVDLSDIEVGVNYGRWQDMPLMSDIQERAASIEREGQLTPCIVQRLKPSNKLRLVAGRTRYEAIAFLNENRSPDERMRIKVIVMEGNDNDAVETSISENIERRDQSPMDKARSIKYLTDICGKTDAQIAQKMRFNTVSSVSQYRSLLNLSYSIQAKIHSGELSFSDGLELLKHDDAQRSAILQRMELMQQEASPTPPISSTPTDSTPVQSEDAVTTGDQATSANPEQGDPASKPRRKRGPNLLKQATAEVTGKAIKRTASEVRDFFEVMIGSPVISKSLQAVAQEVLNVFNGTHPPDEQIERLEEAITGTKSTTAGKE